MQNNTLDSNYLPHENEVYMSKKQILFFKNKLEIWLQNLNIKNNKIDDQIKDLNNTITNQVDIHQLTKNDLLSEKETNLGAIYKINVALKKIKQNKYGYCELLKIPIGVKRLIAIPTARFSLEAQMQFEQQKNNNLLNHQ